MVSAVLALLFWQAAVQARSLAESTVPVTFVEDEDGFAAALARGDQNIVVTDHLDLTASSVSVGPGTSSISGNCSEQPSQRVLSAVSGAHLLPLERGQCLLLLSESVTYEADSSRLWLYNLYLRHATESSSATSPDAETSELLTLAGGSTWCEQVTLQGVKLTDLGYGPPALGFQCAGVSVENSTFSDVTVAGDSAIIVGRSVAGCFAGCKLADVTFPNNDTAMALRASSNQVTFFTTIIQFSSVYNEESDFFQSTADSRDASVFPATFIDSNSSWVVEKRQELGYVSVSDEVAQEGGGKLASEGVRGRARPPGAILAAAVGCPLVAVLAVIAGFWIRRRRRRQRLLQTSKVEHSSQQERGMLPPVSSKGEDTTEEYIYLSLPEGHLASPVRAPAATRQSSAVPQALARDASTVGSRGTTVSTVPSSYSQGTHPSATQACSLAAAASTNAPLQPDAASAPAPPTASRSEQDSRHAAHESGSTQKAGPEGAAMVSINDMWAEVNRTPMGRGGGAQAGSSRAGGTPPEAPRPPRSDLQHPAAAGGAAASSSGAYMCPHPVSMGGSTATSTVEAAYAEGYASKTTASHSHATSTTQSMSVRHNGARVHGDLGTLSMAGSIGTVSDAEATTESQKQSPKPESHKQVKSHSRRKGSRVSSRSRASGMMPRMGSSHGLDHMGLAAAGMRSLDRGGSVQSRGGREMLPELQEPAADEDAGESADVQYAVEALEAQQARQRSSGGHEISIGALQLVLVNEPVAQGRRVVQRATVVGSEAPAQPPRTGSGLTGASELSLSGQKSAHVRERDNVELQVFVDHADFTADQTLRRSPIGPLLRPQLAAYEQSGAAAYNGSPRASVAGDRAKNDRCPQLFDFSVAATAPVDCSLAEVLSGAQKLGGSFQELVVLENLSRKFNTLHGEVNRAHMNFHPALMVCSRSEWLLEGFECSASFGAQLPVEWLRRRRRLCPSPLVYSAPELITAQFATAEPLVASGALDCWAVGVTVFQLFFKHEAAGLLPLSDEQVLEMALGRQQYPWERLQAQVGAPHGPQQFQRLALTLLARDPAQRCTADSALLQVLKAIE